MLKRNIKRILAAIMTLTMISTAALAAGFPDMPDDRSTPALEHAVQNGLLKGDGEYIKPNDNLTRAQMAAIVNRVFGAVEEASLTSYVDVPSGVWYYNDMAKAVHMGVFTGSGDRLEPERNITRQEAFLVLARAFKLTDGDLSALDRFADKGSVSSWASTAVSALVRAGYADGSDGYISPAAVITRAEIAKIMDNLVKTYFSAPGTYTSAAPGNVMINTPDVTLKGIKVAGDLIIGDGVGDGSVTLSDVTVSGRTVIRGGGVHSVRITGTSNLQNIIVARVNGEVRVTAEDGAEVGQVFVDGSDDVIIEGSVGTVTVEASNVTVTATNADIATANIKGENSKIVVDAGSTVSALTVDAPKASVDVAGQVKKAVVNGEGTTVTGNGNVDKVAANANNLKVTTPDTDVTAAAGTTGVTAGPNTVSGGSTVNTGPASVILGATQAPTITVISPSYGPYAGGTTVKIIGTNFTGATSVTFGGTPATDVTVISGTTLTAKTPAHAGGLVDVAVTTPGGTATCTGGYAYVSLLGAMKGSGSYADGDRISFNTQGTPCFNVLPHVLVSAYDASGNPLAAIVTAISTTGFTLVLRDLNGNSVTGGATVYWWAFADFAD